MNQEPLTLYKLIVLYLLNKVSFPLTMAQVSDLILEKEYTSYLTCLLYTSLEGDSNTGVRYSPVIPSSCK